MKNILLATDFSANAQHAVFFAGELCSRSGSRLIIFHILSPLEKIKEINAKKDKQSPEELAQIKLDALAHLMHDRFGIPVSRLLKPGFAQDEIPELAKLLKAELLVMGTQGEHFSTDRLLGSLSNEILQKASFPVICVPAEHLWNLPHNILKILKQKETFCNPVGMGWLSKLQTQLG